MLRLTCICAVLVGPAVCAAAQGSEGLTLEAGPLRIALNAAGRITELCDTTHDQNYASPETESPLLSLERGGAILAPTGMEVAQDSGGIMLHFAEPKATAEIAVVVRPEHLSFELTGLSGPVPDKIHWGPFHTTIGETIGETIGVVRGSDFAIGVQALNMKTLGGASATGTGSAVHARCIDYTRPIPARKPGRLDTPPLEGADGSVIGSRIALFGCAVEGTLDVIGRIEVAEGLPHPMLNGVWAKVSPDATRSYMIMPFGEATMAPVLDAVEQAGLKYVYQGNPFQSWGHFGLNLREFPDGEASLKRCVDLAAARGIGVGVHTLSNFIQPNDPYVTPVPDPRLVRLGTARLAEDLDASSREVPVADPAPFRDKQDMATIVIGGELIRYDAVSQEAPWRLLDCERGAFGTEAAQHKAGAEVGKLWDHAYKTFFPNLEMQDEMALRIAGLFNRTGLRQVSFDGLEGCDITGYGAYAEARFVKTTYDAWEHGVINDSSQLKHFTWHMHTRMNWGEPWGKAMREGMPEYRFRNQAYFERNLLPPMLGWFVLRSATPPLEATSLDEVEWVLAKSAGFGAGCAWDTSLYALDRLGNRDTLLDAICQWERLRHAGAFSLAQRERLRDPAREFHLDTTKDTPLLVPVAFSPPLVLQEEPARWTVHNPFAPQPLQFTLRVSAAAESNSEQGVVNPVLTVGKHRLVCPVQLRPGQYFVLDGQGTGTVHDENWNVLETVGHLGSIPSVTRGDYEMGLQCSFQGSTPPRVELRVRTIGTAEPIV